MHSKFNYFYFPAVLLAVFLCMATFELSAQEAVSNTQVSKQVIEARTEEVKVNTEIDDDFREKLVDSYNATIAQIASAQASAVKAEAFSLMLTTAPEQENKLRAELNDDDFEATDVLSELPDDASMRDFQQHLQAEKIRESTESATRSSLEQKLAAEAMRQDIVRQELQDTRDAVIQLAAELKLDSPSGEASLLTESRRWGLSAQVAAANAKISMLEQEMLSQPVRVELLTTNRDVSVVTLKQIGARVLLLEKALAVARKSETDQLVAESSANDLQRLESYPVIREMIEQNLQLGQELQSLTSQLASVHTANRQVIENIKEIEESFSTARQRMDIAGVNKALGRVLHEQRRELLEIGKFQLSKSELEQDIAEAGLNDIRYASEWREMRDRSTYTATRMAGVAAAHRDDLVGPVTELVKKRRDLLRNTIDTNADYQRALAELNFQQGNAKKVAAEFDAFLVENLLWVRNKQTISLGALLTLPGEWVAEFSPKPWLEMTTALISDGIQLPWFELAILIFLVLVFGGRRLRRSLRATAATVGNPRKDSIKFTFRALLITILLALPLPLLVFSAGWEIGQYLEASVSTQVIGTTLRSFTLALFFQRVLTMLCLDGGLAQAHFKWPEPITRTLGKQTRYLWLTFLLPVFVMIQAVNSHADTYGGELARIAFILAIAGLGAFMYQLLKPNTGLIRRLCEAKGYSTRFAWFWAIIGLVDLVVLALAAIAGYLYSAVSLMTYLVESLWFIFTLVIVRELITRWLLILSGRIQFKIFKQKRDAMLAARERQKEDAGMSDIVTSIPEEPPSDLASISADTNKLVSFILLIIGFLGLGAIWSSVLPALSVFRDITMWEYLEGITGQEHIKAVTLADFLLAIVYLMVTVFAAKSIPPLIKVLLRYSSTITPGSRVAFATLARYSIVIAGVSIIASTVGWNWNKIQWLVAAMSVGIGFGLQEIIANFISGIIILVERPIRIGDLVTVGDTSGVVTRLQIRATTITNFDRQEMLVPNKEFITARVLNWSLTDDVIRLVLIVGVAYGTDMKQAIALVKQAVVEHDLVLKDPTPLITFSKFGDNSLEITARCLIGELTKRREVLSDLHLAINEKFNEAGVVIAFPQRDVHLNTVGPLDIRIQKEPTSGAGPASGN